MELPPVVCDVRVCASNHIRIRGTYSGKHPLFSRVWRWVLLALVLRVFFIIPACLELEHVLVIQARVVTYQADRRHNHAQVAVMMNLGFCLQIMILGPAVAFLRHFDTQLFDTNTIFAEGKVAALASG